MPDSETEKSFAKKALEAGVKVGIFGIALGLFIPSILTVSIAIAAGSYVGSKVVK